jgi:hypothetical protein
MPTLASLLMSLAGPLAFKVLTALGFGFITFSAITPHIEKMINEARTSYEGLPADVLSILSIAGFGDGLGYLSAALVTRSATMALKKLALI